MSAQSKNMDSLNFGDFIKINFKDKEFNGDFIRIDEDADVLIMKLKSGYDIAIPRKEIRGLSIIQRVAKEKVNTLTKSESYSFDNPDLTIITTGGTISSKIDYKRGGTSPFVPPEYYFQIAPDLKKYGNVAINKLMSIWSEDMAPRDWIKIAIAALSAIKKGSKGIMVTMGTDTMHFASAAMSFILNPLSVPVVFTGAQRSTDRGSTDASTNLLLSAITALKWGGGESVICMHANLNDNYNFILRGNRARKMHSERRDAFRPINTLPLGKVYLDGKIEKLSENIKRSEETSINTKLDEKVALLVSYPGMDGNLINAAIEKGTHGIVIAGTGFGNLPLKEKSVYNALKRAKKEDIPVVLTSQTIYGATNEFVYSRLRELSNFDNIIYVGNMLTETAFAKLMFVLGQTKKIEEVKTIMNTTLAGEISDKDNLNEFLI